ncbi:hypothetical protein GCM10011273_18310 [Asticcacaulis endophyticus]|uniref:Protein ImuA n=1 Tax=Asticcacaulis endophyticus TaxID=1395890 RepID=A0A918Q3D4_9CAUL|nr:hypothetical protein GCM10011273_18310 [Asticcacaulis endophyticus]
MARRGKATLPFGVPAIDTCLPNGGLAMGALHEVAGGSTGALNGAAASQFAAGIAARLTGKVVWCVSRKGVYPPALEQAGLTPDRIIFVDAVDNDALLAVFEEGLRHGGFKVVIGEVTRLAMMPSRRLQLAAETTGAIGIAIRRWDKEADVADYGHPNAAVTRWRVTAAPPGPSVEPGLDRPRWYLELLRCQGRQCADFEVEACNEQGLISIPSDLANGQASEGFGRGWAVS